MRLTVCASCSRHVRETLCPFCGANVAPSAAAPRTKGRRSRFAIVGAAAAAVATAACGSVQALYGAVIPDASTDGGDAGDAQAEAMGTFYGAVFPDASKD